MWIAFSIQIQVGSRNRLQSFLLWKPSCHSRNKAYTGYMMRLVRVLEKVYRTDRPMDWQIDGQADGWTDGLTDWRMNERTDGRTCTSSCRDATAYKKRRGKGNQKAGCASSLVLLLKRIDLLVNTMRFYLWQNQCQHQIWLNVIWFLLQSKDAGTRELVGRQRLFNDKKRNQHRFPFEGFEEKKGF